MQSFFTLLKGELLQFDIFDKYKEGIPGLSPIGDSNAREDDTDYLKSRIPTGKALRQLRKITCLPFFNAEAQRFGYDH
jgi:hypothetical protein